MTRQLIPAQRRERIREYLQIYHIVRSADLGEMLGVSEATIRRDLEWLESQGFLERTHGGAILSQRMRIEPEYAYRAQTHPEEKRLIGAAAAAMIEDGDIVFISSGTTATQTIPHIRSGANITVITNNVSAVLEVQVPNSQDPSFKLILLGGSFRLQSHSMVGRFTTETLRQIYASKAFIGVDGISPKYGCTVPSSAEAEVIRLMIQRTHGPIIALADSSKWGVVSNFEVATVDQIHRLVTDSGLDPRARAELAARSVEIIIADTEPDLDSRDRSGD
jgi:DeoR/GlpR family transcriptional regulator of sugar metabolism